MANAQSALEKLNKKYGIKGSTTPKKDDERKQSKSASSNQSKSTSSKSTSSKAPVDNSKTALEKLNEKYGIKGNYSSKPKTEEKPKTKPATNKNSTYSFNDYSSAVKYLNDKGVSGASGIMTEREWQRRNRSGGTYQDYLNNQVNKYGKGNIDLTNRPVYINSDNTISTVDSVTVGIDGKQYLLPSIVTDKNGKAKRLTTTDDIVNHYKATGEYLGVFDTVDEANKYGVDLHNSQADYYGKRKHLTIDNEGETLYFGNVTDEGYKAITEGNLANYTPKDASERLAIAEFTKWANEEAKRQRNPENWWKGILHSIPYSLGKVGAGAVDFVGDIGDLALAGISGAGGLLADIGSKAAGLTGSDYLENHLGQLSDEMYDNAEYRLQADTLGDMWNASIESRYRVPDWYRENVGQSLMSVGSMAVPVVVEMATKGLAPTEAYTSAQLAKMASTASATKSTGFAQATKNLANKLITPSMSTHEALFGLGATASTTKEAYKETGNVGKSLTYGVLNGLGEVATERLFGGYAGTGYGSGSSTITSGGRIMKVLPDVVEPLFNYGSVKYISKFASTKFGSKVLDLAFEGVEEGIMAWADPVFRKATINSDKGLKELYGDARFGEAFFQGVLLSTIMNAGQYAIGKPIEKFTDYRRKINFINDLNTDTQKINEMLPEGTATFEPLGNKATQEEIEQRYSDLERVSVIIGVNKAIDAVNSIVKSDESKIIPLGNDATIEEIQQRQKELMAFGTQYADLMAEELVKNNPNAFSNLETPSNSFVNNQADTNPIQEEKPLKTEFQVANEKANEAAFEAGRQNIPREKVNLTTLDQEEAYNRGRIEYIKNMPKETTKSTGKTTDRAKTVLGDGEKSVGVANGQAYVTNGKDILPSPTNRSVFIPVDNVEVAKTELGATESIKTSENIGRILASDFTPVSENFVDGTLEDVGEVRVFTDENGREIALEKNVAEYFDGYNLEATFRGGKPYAIKATDNNGNVKGVAMAVWTDKSGQEYEITDIKDTNTIQTGNTVKMAKNTVRDDIVNSRKRQTFTLGELNEISEADETLDVQEVRDVTGYGEKGAELVTKYANYEGVSLDKVLSEVEDAYFKGFENPNKPMGKFETKAQEQAYKAGQQDRRTQNSTARENAKKATIYKGAFTENEYTKNFTKAEKTMISIVAKALKMDISVVDKIIANEFTGQEANAEHQNGKMLISSTAEQIAQKVVYKLVMHESGHRLKQLAPDEFGVLMDALYKRSKRENAKSGRYKHAGFDNVKTDYENADLAMSNESMDTLDYFEEFAVRELETIFSSAREFNKWYAEISGNKQVKSAWDKFVDFILDAIDSIKRKFQLATMSKDERAKANKSPAELDRIKGLLANTYKAAESAVAEKNGTVVDAKGNAVAQINEDGTASFSLKTYDDSGRAELKRWLDRNVKNKKLTEAEAKDISEQLEYYYDICKEYEDKYAPFSVWSKAEVVKGLDGKPLMSVVKANGEYKMNLDFSLVCKKRRPLDALYRAMIDDGFMDNIGQLSEVEVARINEIIRKNGFETACTLCFVDSKRYRQYAVADSFVSKYNELVKMLAPEGAKIDRFDFSGKRPASADGLHTMSDAELKAGINKLNKVIKEHGETTVVGKIAKHLKASAKDRKLVMVSDFMDSEGFVRVKKANPNVFKLYNSSKGSGGPKATLPDVQYLGEILKRANFTPKKAYAVGGVRVQSFSDYIPRLVFDYLQMTADLTAKRLPAHAYSKEDIFVMQFGKTGIKINMSLVPAVAKDGIAPGLDKNGNYVWVDGHTFASDFHDKGSGQRGFELAVKIQNTEGYSQNCGTIAVGVSDEHIIKMLKDNDIRMVIPYHKSSLNHFVAKMGNIDQYKDYTNVQNTRDKATGKKIEGKDFNFNEAFHRLGDAKAATNEYLAWCDKNNYLPKFDTFAYHEDAQVRENYYKVLIDFAAYDSEGNPTPQGAVTMNFPTENDAFGSMKSLIEKGLEADAILEGRKTENIPKILDEVKSVLGETKATEHQESVELSDVNTRYSLRKKEPPKKTGVAYKVFYAKDGKLYPPMVANPNGEGTPVGVWLDADIGKAAPDSKTGRPQVQAGGKGTNASKGSLAFRPGWHLGDIPHATQFARKNPETGVKDLFPADFVWAECEYAMDNDYQDEAMSYGYTENGKFRHSYAGLPKLPTDGYYRYRTNPKPDTVPWIITGAMKVNRILTDAETDAICRKNGIEPMKRQGGVLELSKYGLKAGETSNFSLKGGLSDTEIRKAIADKNLSKYVEKGTITTEKYNELIEKYGVIPSGERPHRDIQVPQKSGKKKNVSQTVRTILEAEATPDEAVPTIEKMVEDGIFSYDAYTDKQAINDAKNYIKEYGWDESLDDWFDAVNKGEVSKELTATGWALYNNAANLAATTTSETERTTAIKTSLKILDAMVRHQRSAAQALQATRILKKLSPETQLYGVQKSVSAFQKELTDKYGDKAPNLKIDEKLAEQFLNAKTSEERAKIEEKIYKDIGRQMPSRFIDKWNAWRYLAMLGNPRTHIRNSFGNLFFAPVVLTKDLTATAIESVVSRVSTKKFVRGKALIIGNKADRALLKAAWGDFKNVSNLISNGGKYNDAAMNNQHIEDGRRIFKFKPLEWARKKNSQLLELEDMWFSQPHYAYALAQYCKANNISAEQISRGKAIAPARDYAIKEAQKATYRDTNAFSQMVSGWGRSKKDSNVIQKAFNTTIEGILPFRKTPANILVRGLEYSPLGLLKGLSYDLYQVSKGKMSATDAIDNISAGLTGTGLLSLGIYLAAQGLIRGHGEEEEEEKGFKELMGHQSYALELPNGQSITLDWLAPEALPFFVGVNIWETSIGTDEKANLSTILKSVSNISEPMLELSCLQSLNDLFESVGYATSNDTSGLMSILSSAATSYLTQGIPTLLGQTERTGEENRMTTYTEKDNFFTGDMQYTLGKASAKIPFWDFNQIPYIDAWGRKEASGTKLKRGLNNFLNPAYTSKIETSDMEKELLRLYEETGEGSVFPSRADKYFVVDGVRKDLTADEYVRYATLKGEKSYKAVNDLVNSKAYRELSDGEKAKAIAEAYDYANQKAKDAISNYKPDSWVNKTDDSSSSNFISFKVEVSSTKDANDGKITKEQAVDIILDTAQNDSQKWQMYLSMYDSKTATKAEKHDIDAELFMTAVVDMAEIKADYKANGKVVSGSRRKKIERYLNSVCSSYKEYLFLLGMEYDSVKDDADYISYFGKEE